MCMSLMPRTSGAIALHPMGNAQGSHDYNKNCKLQSCTYVHVINAQNCRSNSPTSNEQCTGKSLFLKYAFRKTNHQKLLDSTAHASRSNIHHTPTPDIM